jgi:hypothetical protein
LVVGGGQDLAQQRPRHAAPDRQMQVRGEAFLRFHAAEVLGLIPEHRRRSWMKRSNSAAKWIASRADRV